jgi:hypothetical protein
MSINEGSATALIRFTGLGIVCFNKDPQRGEIAVIRDHHHTLTIKLQKPVYQDGANSDVIVYQDIATYEKLPKDDVRIEIKATGKPAIAGYELYQTGEFDRLESPDVNDFRWIVNMHRLHGQKTLKPTTTEKFPLTKLYISNGLFYTHKLDTNLFFEKVEKDASGAAKQREDFGNVGETIGVKIEGDEVSFTIHTGGRKETHSLKRVAGFPYRIEIKNMDYNADAVYSDLPDYYRYLASPNGQEFDLAPIAEETGGSEGGSINSKEFCHPIVVDDPPSIDDLGA